MATAEIRYLGELRTEITHLRSQTSFNTDAPLDNKGRGEFISPTDMVAAAMGACMETIVGIYCQEHDLPFHHAKITVIKIMADKPRRISALELHLDFSGNGWNEKTRRAVKAAAEACPVAKSIHPDIAIKFDYNFGE